MGMFGAEPIDALFRSDMIVSIEVVEYPPFLYHAGVREYIL